jgi:hypothetical protein
MANPTASATAGSTAAAAATPGVHVGHPGHQRAVPGLARQRAGIQLDCEGMTGHQLSPCQAGEGIGKGIVFFVIPLGQLVMARPGAVVRLGYIAAQCSNCIARHNLFLSSTPN